MLRGFFIPGRLGLGVGMAVSLLLRYPILKNLSSGRRVLLTGAKARDLFGGWAARLSRALPRKSNPAYEKSHGREVEARSAGNLFFYGLDVQTSPKIPTSN